MNQRRPQKTRRRPINNAIWFITVAAVLIAAWRILPTHDPKDWWTWAQQNSQTLEQGYEASTTELNPQPALKAWQSILPSIQTGDNTENTTRENTNQQTTPNPQLANTANERLQTITITPENTNGYNRDTWRHWDNITPCWSVREAVLARDAQPGTLTLQNKNKQPTTDLKTACYITGGIWNDPYTGQTFTNPQDLDIDHLVPLSEAHASGAHTWNEETKRNYANDLRSNHLLAVSASANRSKGDKDPAEWMPPNKTIHCGYIASWIAAKQRWNLSIDPNEHKTITNTLANCQKTS